MAQRDPPTPEAPLGVLSLFCGGGGLDLGFRTAGFETVLAIDSSSASVNTMNRNFGAETAIKADIRDIVPHVIEQELGSRGRAIPVGVIGGPPCQGFSNGNVTTHVGDVRNRLPIIYAHLVAALHDWSPLDFFVFENVTGLLRRRHANRYAGMLAVFRDAGFALLEREMDAADFGVPQVRKRIFVIGFRDAAAAARFVWPQAIVGKRVTVRETISDLPAATLFRRGMMASDVGFHENHWTMMPKSKRFADGQFNRWRSFRKLEWDTPSPTVAYGNREIHVHPDGQRRLSVYEAMLLQSFPRDYALCGNLSEQVTQVSNAVPPLLAGAIAAAIRVALTGSEKRAAA